MNRKRIMSTEIRLPSYTFDEFVAHVKKGPGFGCWPLSRIRRAWGKRERVDARDIAERLKRQEGFGPHFAFYYPILFSLLPRKAWKLVWEYTRKNDQRVSWQNPLAGRLPKRGYGAYRSLTWRERVKASRFIANGFKALD